MLHYLAVIEKGPNNYSGFFPDVPGCVAAGHTIEETMQLLQEALQFHLESMLEDGEELPKPNTWLYHYQKGTFKEREIGATYLLANMAIEEHQLAA
jgi:predicted RNase H-like HicB family nuclease